MKKIALILSIMLLSGCAVPKQMTAMGGSKADGTIKMGYSYGMFEVPEVDENHAAYLASQKCQVWGYESAEPFGGQVSQCVKPSSSGCVETAVYVEFQCIGGKASQH